MARTRPRPRRAAWRYLLFAWPIRAIFWLEWEWGSSFGLTEQSFRLQRISK